MALPALLLWAVLPPAHPVEDSREIRLAFGTLAEIQASGGSDPERAVDSAFRRIEEVESSLSVWEEESEIARLNAKGEAVLSPIAFDAVVASLEMARASGGAFDPTLTASGYRLVEFDRTTRRVRLGSGLKLDLGGIAKGYAVDLAIGELSKAGTARGLVDLGTSSIGVFGNERTLFEIRNPRGGPAPASFRLRRGAVGSSSKDQRGNHILDPRSGRTSKKALAATVICRSAAEADALSTAAFVLGPDEGLELLRKRGAEGVILFDEGGRLALASTEGFKRRYELEAAEGVVVRSSVEVER